MTLFPKKKKRPRLSAEEAANVLGEYPDADLSAFDVDGDDGIEQLAVTSAAKSIRKIAALRLSPKEAEAVAALKKLAKTWPKTLWLFAGGEGGSLHVMIKHNGEHAMLPNGSVDPAWAAETIDIEADGGGW